ncbi:MAG: sigma 54-interacting transcriptional regulator [Candidatus Aureabacteria bacterium]|nr:sigma 54-interacting transcriptional regulator [Candidatus Auribacterota bacterium]
MFIHVFYKDEFIKTVRVEKETEELVIGRAVECPLSLSYDHMISRKHAKITFDKEGAAIEDMQSKNGIYIDGKRVQKSKLPLDKRIFLGDSSLIASRDAFREIKKTVSLDSYLLNGLKKVKEKAGAENALSFLYDFSSKLGHYSSEESMIDDLFEKLISVFHPGRIILFNVIKKEKDAAVRKLTDVNFMEERESFSRSVIDEMLKTRQAVFLQNVAQEILDADRSIRNLGISSLMAVPLLAGKDFIGILQIEFFQPNRTFSDEDFYILCILSQMLSGFLKGVRTISQVKKENTLYREQLKENMEIIGSDRKTQKMKTLISQVARTNTTVLITGESGTGKELVARGIHFESKRKERPFLVINCAAIPGNLIESELFGHVKGAFTGAEKTRLGKLEAANGGTVFLDEIGDMSLELQTRLLRFLETGELQPVGSNETKYSDVRIIAATNRDLKKSVKEGLFRKDLFFRLSVFQIDCPPLRARGKDVLLIAQHYLLRFSSHMGKNMAEISSEAQKILLAYPWPGNIRELKNIMERACVIGSGESLIPDYLPEEIREPKENMDMLFFESSASIPLSEIEKKYVLRVLKEQGNNKAKTAQILGITRKTLYTKLREYGIHG